MRKLAREAGFGEVSIGLKNAWELMQRAFVGMVASGTATLESSFYPLPFVLIYKVSWLTMFPGVCSSAWIISGCQTFWPARRLFLNLFKTKRHPLDRRFGLEALQ